MLAQKNHRSLIISFFIFSFFLLLPLIVLAGQKIWQVGFAQDTMTKDWRVAQVREVENVLKGRNNIHFFYADAQDETARSTRNILNNVPIPSFEY